MRIYQRVQYAVQDLTLTKVETGTCDQNSTFEYSLKSVRPAA